MSSQYFVRARAVVAALWVGMVAACGAQDEPPQRAPVHAARQALNVTLWSETLEAAPPAPLTGNDVSRIFDYVSGSHAPSGTSFVGRIAGTAGPTGAVHGGSYGVLFRAQAAQPASAGVPTYGYELRKRFDTAGYSNLRLTFWRKLLSFEAVVTNGQVSTDRFVVRYATVANPGAGDWTEAWVVPTASLGTWAQDTVENLPASSTLWISFLADYRARLNTAVTPNVHQFDEWTYLDDFALTGDFGCTTSADCSDDNACTSDVCNVATGVCSNPAIACDDGLFCNGTETCDPSGGCVAGAAPVVDDGVRCTIDECDEALHAVVNAPDHRACSDRNACTHDACVAGLGCTYEITPDAPCGGGYCSAEGDCLPDEDGPCAGLEDHAPCGTGASWCEGGQCTLSFACGDGWLNRAGEFEPIEACDDGNNLSGDACSPACVSEVVALTPSGVADLGQGVRVYAADALADGRLLIVWQASDGRLLARRMTQTGLVNEDDATPIAIDALLGGAHAQPDVIGGAASWSVLYSAPSGPGTTHVVRREVFPDGTVLQAETTSDAPEAQPQAAALGDSHTLLARDLGTDIELELRDDATNALSSPDAPNLLAALHGAGAQRDAGLVRTPNGAWVLWRDGASALHAGLVRAPGYSLEIGAECDPFVTCFPAMPCGDGWREAGEQCDDGNAEWSDGCEPTCELTPTCTPTGGSDDSCDYVDDDCDDVLDEGFGGESTLCGVGACAAQGATACIDGEVVDDCAPSEPIAADDFTCDHVDDDCDGEVDEDCTCTAQTATLAAHASAGRAFVCGATAVTFFSDGFESGAFEGWTASGNYAVSSAISQAGSYSAQAQGPGTSMLRRTFDTSGLSTVSMSFNVRTRGPTTTDYGLSIRRSTDGGATWNTIASAPGPFAAWQAATFTHLPSSSALLISFEATPSDATRFVHWDNVAIRGTCATPTYFASGSQARLGTGASESVTLHSLESEPSLWRSGACPIAPAP